MKFSIITTDNVLHHI